MKQLSCIIVDDEPLACRLLESYALRTPELTVSGVFNSADKALEAIGITSPDIAFLDIQMPGMTGMEMARLIPASTRVVFTTAYPDFAVEGFRVNALDYLLKPVSYAEFLESVGRARQALMPSRPTRFITVKSEYRLLRIDTADIICIEGLKDYIKIHLASQPRPTLTLMSMKAAEAMLAGDNFLRVHRSFIANLDRVTSVSQGRIMCGGREIPVSDSCRPALITRLKKEQ